MPEYTRAEAREWARGDLEGVCGCLLPTFNSSLTKVNEAAIRHDVRLSKEYGFWGTLLVPETGTNLEQFRDVIDIATDEARAVGLRTMLSGAFPTLDENIDMARYAESAGVDLLMPGYPLMFYPQSEDEVFEYTKALADSCNLGILLFAIHHWNFGRLHPSGTLSPRLLRRMVDELPTVVGIKNEIGMPALGGITEVFERFNDEVVVTEPFEQNAPIWVKAYGMKFMGTADYEFAGPRMPEYLSLLRAGKLDDAMELYWQLEPVRRVRQRQAGEYLAGTNLIHRTLWKYEGWLSGFNGGPVRQPLPRITDMQMTAIRAAHVASGLDIAPGSDADFFVGRNPMD